MFGKSSYHCLGENHVLEAILDDDKEFSIRIFSKEGLIACKIIDELRQISQSLFQSFKKTEIRFAWNQQKPLECIFTDLKTKKEYKIKLDAPREVKHTEDTLQLQKKLASQQIDKKSFNQQLEGFKNNMQKNAAVIVPEGLDKFQSVHSKIITERHRLSLNKPAITYEYCNFAIQGIRELITYNFDHIRMLSLERNCLCSKSIQVLTRKPWPNLKILNLGKNELTRIIWNVKNINGLMGLSLEFNFIQNLPEDIVNLSQLERLDVHHNLLKNIPDFLKKLTKLTSLWLNDNYIPKIQSHPCFVALKAIIQDPITQRLSQDPYKAEPESIWAKTVA